MNLRIFYQNQVYLIPITKALKCPQLQVKKGEKDYYVGNKRLVENLLVEHEQLVLKLEPKEAILLKNPGTFSIGPGLDISHPNLRMDVRGKSLKNFSNYKVYINQTLRDSYEINFEYGDEICCGDLVILVMENHLYSYHYDCHYQLPVMYNFKNRTLGVRKKSPQIKKVIEEKTLEAPRLAQLEHIKLLDYLWVTLTPVLTMSVSFIIYKTQGMSRMFSLMLATTAVSLIISLLKMVINLAQVRRKNHQIREENNNKTNSFLNSYIEQMTKIRNFYNYYFPLPEDLIKRTITNSSQCYSKIATEQNLDLCLGEVKTHFPITVSNLEGLNDLKVKEKFAILSQPKKLQKVINIKKGNLALVGPTKEVEQHFLYLMYQLLFYYNPEQLKIIFFGTYEDRCEYSFLKNYFHTRDLTMSFVAMSEDHIKNVKSYLENNSSTYEYVIILSSRVKLEKSMEQLITSQKNLSVIDLKTNLHDCSFLCTNILILDQNKKTLYLHEGVEVNQNLVTKEFSVPALVKGLNLLRYIYPSSDKKSHILTRDIISLLGIRDLNNLSGVNEKSTTNLKAKLGIDENGEEVILDLASDADGPHGLIAGTTGSGKSELILTLVISLALINHPQNLNFIIIDFKGGGLAEQLKNLPHLTGTITNLDAAEKSRSLISLKAEVKRRQELFKEYQIFDIDEFQKLHRGKLAHLFVICDEFAELKKTDPSFMSELISIARIGRSLGIHLILATQKPSGVVDEQIWANTAFKICLRVNTANDSNEVIRSSAAVNLVNPGAAILMKNRDHSYTTFQSAYSHSRISKPLKIFRIDKYGQIQKGNQVTKDDLLKQIIDKLNQNYDYHNQLIFPPLPKCVNLPTKELTRCQQAHLLPLGLADYPSIPNQNSFILDFHQVTSLLINGEKGLGKSEIIRNIIYGLAYKNTPSEINFYVVDYFGSLVKDIGEINNVNDVITSEKITEKLPRLFHLIQTEITKRIQIIAESGVKNIFEYNQTIAKEKLDLIFVVIDNLEVILDQGPFVDSALESILQKGKIVGVNLVVSITNEMKLRRNLSLLFDEQFFLGNSDRSLYNQTGEGRIKIKSKDGIMMQGYCYDKEEIIKSINSRAGLTRRKKIKVIPKTLYLSDLDIKQKVPVIGLDKISAEPVYLEDFINPLLIVGPRASGKTNLLELLRLQVPTCIYISNETVVSSPTCWHVNLSSELNISNLVDYINQERTESNYKYMLIDDIDVFLNLLSKYISPDQFFFSCEQIKMKIIITLNNNRYPLITHGAQYLRSVQDYIYLREIKNLYFIEGNKRIKPTYCVININQKERMIKVATASKT